MHTEEEFPKAFDPKKTDTHWSNFWDENNFFKGDALSPKPSFSISMPPPNVTGALHMGHALVSTIQDILTRYKRMNGFEALWIPGTDHAGIATQTVVERHLIHTEGKKRTDYEREAFLEKVWQWKEENQDKIITQLKALGASCDWTRCRFTLDPENNRAVNKMFKLLYDKGLIYKGDYLVNWDPVTRTALADDEVEHEENNSFLWHFHYPLEEGGFIEIATTRPETMLGDTAVAVSLSCPKHKHLIGKNVLLPLSNRKIPIIGDRRVDPLFGTGAVKVTPSHDPNDYEMGIEHKLPFINIMTEEGRINPAGGKFEGLFMEEAREKVIEEMKTLGLFVKAVPHINRVGVSYRSKAIIQPFMSKQWFLKLSHFSASMRETVVTKQVKLIPENFENTYFRWIDNLRDWCISRQLWWGHRIPVWYSVEDPSQILVWGELGVPPEVEANPSLWKQEEDVLDTWFSSALWPFAILGWPDKTPDLNKFYPNSVLVTGHDILFFWVAKMIMMGEFALDTPPFKEVYLHGLIFGKSYWRETKEGGIAYLKEEERVPYDLGKPLPKDVFFKWEKMSKSKGNVINPLEIIEEYGKDAMRMALAASATQAREIDLDRRKFQEFRNFANKIWNGSRFIFLNIASLSKEEFQEGLDLEKLAIEDLWILHSLEKAVTEVTSKIESYQLDQATLQAYDFFWNSVCSLYLEISKPYLFDKRGNFTDKKNKQKILALLLCQSLRLLHPIAPFITEELFQKLKALLEGTNKASTDPWTKETLLALSKKACTVSPYPKKISLDLPFEESSFDLLLEIVHALRNIRGEMKVPLGAFIDVYLVIDLHHPSYPLLLKNKEFFGSLVKISKLELVEKEPSFSFASTFPLKGFTLFVPLPETLKKEEKERLFKEKEKTEEALRRGSLRLESAEFTEKAPQALVEKQKLDVEMLKKELEKISLNIEKLS